MYDSMLTLFDTIYFVAVFLELAIVKMSHVNLRFEKNWSLLQNYMINQVIFMDFSEKVKMF